MEVKVSMENSEAGYKSVSIYSNSGIILEEVTDRINLREACKTVQKNKGAPGIDGVTVLEYACMRETKGYKELSQIIDAGKYRPKPVKKGLHTQSQRRQKTTGDTNSRRQSSATSNS